MISPFQRPPGHVCAQVEGAQVRGDAVQWAAGSEPLF